VHTFTPVEKVSTTGPSTFEEIIMTFEKASSAGDSQIG
jgi:hypothetical protein